MGCSFLRQDRGSIREQGYGVQIFSYPGSRVEPRVTTVVVIASHGPRWLTGSSAPLTSRPRFPEARVHCAWSPPRPPTQFLDRRPVIPSRTPLARNLTQYRG